MAKLYVSLTSPYARKARVIVRELDLTAQVEDVLIDPWTSEELRKLNPLAKVPTLVLDDGSALFDSPVICEYLNELGGGKFFPGQSIWRGSNGRWRALGFQALGDGICEAAGRAFRETRLPEERRNADNIARQTQAVVAGLDMAARACAKFSETPTIGEITIGCALEFLDLRGICADWRDGRPALAAWQASFARYPSMIATAPPA